MTDTESERQAIYEAVQIVPYNDEWPAQYCSEKNRLGTIAPELLAVEHVGSTAVPGLAAKPIIDIMATVPDMQVADRVLERLCRSGYITSAEFNRTLGDRRWLMRHAGGHRTHHLHLVLAHSRHWLECIRFRDALRRDSALAARYADLKQRLAFQLGSDRDGYGNAKADFIASALLIPPYELHYAPAEKGRRQADGHAITLSAIWSLAIFAFLFVLMARTCLVT